MTSLALLSEVREALLQELDYLTRRLTFSLPKPVLLGYGARRHPLRKQTGIHRADVSVPATSPNGAGPVRAV